MGVELEELDTPGVAEPTGEVIFDENPDEIMDAPIDEPKVPPTLPYPAPYCTYTTQRLIYEAITKDKLFPPG